MSSGACVEAKRPEREIEAELSCQDRMIGNLIDIVDQLSIRLQPVLRDPSPEADGADKEQPATALGRSIAQFTNRIRSARDLLSDVLERLEL